MNKQQFLNDPTISDHIWSIWLKSPCSTKYQLRPDGKGALFQDYQEQVYEIYLMNFDNSETPETFVAYSSWELENGLIGTLDVKQFWDAQSNFNKWTGLTQKELNKRFFNIVNNHKELDNELGYHNQLNLNI